MEMIKEVQEVLQAFGIRPVWVVKGKRQDDGVRANVK